MMDSDTAHQAILAELRALRELHTEKFDVLSGEVHDLKAEIKDAGKRINLLELWKENQVGRWAIIGAAIGIGVTLIGTWFVKRFT